MDIKTEAQAQAAISALAEWLQQLNDTAYSAGSRRRGEKRNAELAREWSTKLLEAGEVNALCGCPLCQS